MSNDPSIEPDGARRERPASYGIPTDAEGLLPWSFVGETLTGGTN